MEDVSEETEDVTEETEDVSEETEDVSEETEDVSEETEEVSEETPSKPTLCCRRCSAFLLKYFLPISYTTVVIFGALVPVLGVALDHKATQYTCVVIIFLISGLFLRTNEMKQVFVSYRASLFGIVSILAITSIIGGQLTLLLDFSSTYQDNGNNATEAINKTLEGRVSPLGPLEYQFGLIIFYTMPCTVSSGVVMVSQMNGHVALALFLTVVCNILGIFTVPLFIKWLITSSTDVSLDLTGLILKLCLTLLLPLVVGKGLRFVERIRKFVEPKKPITKIISVLCLDILIWVKISTTSSKGLLSTLNVGNAFFIIGWALALHSLFLLLNTFCCWILRLTYEQKKTVILLASQKTLAVAISVASLLPPSFGDIGVMVIAMTLSHLTILIYDSVLVAVWMHVDSHKQDQFADGDNKDKGGRENEGWQDSEGDNGDNNNNNNNNIRLYHSFSIRQPKL